jgi:phage shock protein A
MRVKRWLAIVLALLILGGGGYSLFAVVWPARYVKGVLEIDRAFRAADSPLASTTPSSGEDVASVLRRLSVLKTFLAETEEKIHALRPAPPRYRQLQEDLEVGVQALREQVATLEQYARFQASVRDLQDLLREVLAPGAGITVGQFLDRYGPELTKIRTTGDALFSGDLPPVPEIQKLRAAWPDAATGLDFLHATLRAQPATRDLQGAIDALRISELRAAEKKIERFQQLLEVAATTPGPFTLGSPENASSELKERFARIGAALDALRQRSPEYTKE